MVSRVGRNTFVWVALALALVSAAPACSFSKLAKDNRTLDSSDMVLGTVEVADWTGDSLIVVHARLPESDEQVLDIGPKLVLTEPGEFEIRMGPGRYMLGAFEDRNRNSVFDRGERGALSEAFELRDGHVIDAITLRIEVAFDPAPLEQYELHAAKQAVVGQVAPLDDPRFAREPAELGLWQPLTYLQMYEPGLYLLEPYDPTRTPVLFIHGMSGCPQEFEPLIESLDHERFQAWVLLYPSGFPLDDVARFSSNALTQLELQLGLDNLCIVAHSMGGLVARGILHHYVQSEKPGRVGAFVTLASPLDGMPSAAMGTKMAPSVVPSWYDLAPGSPYLTKIYTQSLPAGTEYQLLFAFDGHGGSDGVVPLTSQLRDEAQAEATLIAGYRATHTGILRSASATAQVNRALDLCRGDRSLSPRATRVIDDPSGL